MGSLRRLFIHCRNTAARTERVIMTEEEKSELRRLLWPLVVNIGKCGQVASELESLTLGELAMKMDEQALAIVEWLG
jgi:hypothetical protein